MWTTSPHLKQFVATGMTGGQVLSKSLEEYQNIDVLLSRLEEPADSGLYVV